MKSPSVTENKHKSVAGSESSLLRQNLPLVHKTVASLQSELGQEHDMGDLIAVGTLGLVKAIEHRNEADTESFEEFAVKNIREAIVKEFAKSSRRAGKESKTPSSEEEKDVDVKGCRILVVDDSKMSRTQIKFLLKKAGFEIFEAKSGEEALWLAPETTPDLVLMDVQMGDLDGFETCRRLKTLPGFADIPVIFLTGKGSQEDVLKGLEAGGVDYIVKPYHHRESLCRIRTHLKLRVLMRMQEKYIKDLKTANTAKDKVLRVTTHDLKNPISAIRGLANFLEEGVGGPVNEDGMEMIRSIGSASDSMMALLNDLLDISTLTGEDVRLELLEHDLVEVTSHVVTLYRVKAEAKGIDVRFFHEGNQMPLNCDKRQIRRIMENLLSNAVKFSPSGSHVEVFLKKAREEYIFEVRDNGPGIPQEEQHKLFKEFGRTSVRPSGNESSTGLGLSICKRLAEAHGGTITMRNAEAGGAIFSVSLPRTDKQG